MGLLDVSVIDDLRDALGDETYAGYAKRMLSEMQGLGAELAAQVAGGDRELLAQTAHRAAGSAVSVGASGLHGRLKAIEDAARTGGAGLDALVAGFQTEVAATEAAITALINAP